MPLLSNDELQKVQAWLHTKKLDNCSVCNQHYPFGNIADLGLASIGWGEQDEGYLREKAGHVDLLVIPTYETTGAVRRNSTYPPRSTPERALQRVFSALHARPVATSNSSTPA